MKVWKVININADDKLLEDILNRMQKENKNIKEIIYNSEWKEYQIIYTIEDIE